jgi:hypothetical protein
VAVTVAGGAAKQEAVRALAAALPSTASMN